MPLDLTRLECGRPTCQCKRTTRAGRGLTHCPAHDDDTPSLSVATKPRWLVHCHSGCPQDEVIRALRDRGAIEPAEHRPGLTLADLADAKRLPLSVLREWRAYEAPYGGAPAVYMPYFDRRGRKVGTHVRVALDGDRFRWAKGSRVTLYGLWRLPQPPAKVIVVEGETDCWAASVHGLAAVGIPGKATWRPEWAEALRAYDVAVWIEPGADDLVDRVAAHLPKARVVRAFPEHKDIAAMHAAGVPVRERILEAWRRAPLAAAVALRPHIDGGEHQRLAAMLRDVRLALCRQCGALVMRWADGMEHDWPSRTVHACSRGQQRRGMTRGAHHTR